MNDLPEVIKFSNIESYVDDTKIYFSFASKDIDTCLREVAVDLRHVSERCCANHLLTYPEKTKFVLFGVRHLISQLPSNITVPFLGQALVPITSAKDLGVTLDSNLPLNGYIASLTFSLLSTLVQINRVRHLFYKEVLCIILNSLVFSKLFYCSTVWFGTSKENIHNYNLCKTLPAEYLLTKKTFITPVLHELGLLTIEALSMLTG